MLDYILFNINSQLNATNSRIINDRVKSKQVEYHNDSNYILHLNSLAMKASQGIPHTLLDIGKNSSGADFQSSFGKKPSSSLVKTLVFPTKYMSNDFLAKDLELTLKIGIYVGAFWEKEISSSKASSYAKKFVNHLISGDGETWYDDGGLSDVIKNTSEGKKLIRKVSQELKKQMILYQGDFTKIQLKAGSFSTLNFNWSSSPTLKILIGGSQRLKVELVAIFYDLKNKKWMALIKITIHDDFGVTESDIINASPAAKLGVGGLLDFWVLQHNRGKKPFTSVFSFSFFCSGNL